MSLVVGIFDITGAFNSTQESLRRSQQAQRMVDQSQGTILESEDIRTKTEQLMDERKDEFENKLQENEDTLSELNDRVDTIDSNIVDLNDLVSVLLVYTMSDYRHIRCSGSNTCDIYSRCVMGPVTRVTVCVVVRAVGSVVVSAVRTALSPRPIMRSSSLSELINCSWTNRNLLRIS